MTYNLNSTLLNLNDSKASVFLDYPLILFRIERVKVKKNQRLYFHFYYFNDQNDLISINLISKSFDMKFEIKDLFNTQHNSIYVGAIEYDFEKINHVNDFIIDSFSSSKGIFVSLEKKVINYKFSLAQEYYIEKYNSIVFGSSVVPNLNDVYWQCTCGFINSNSKRKCGFCNQSKDLLVNIPLNDSKSFIYKVITESNPIKFNYDLDFEENIKILLYKIESLNMDIDDFRNSQAYLNLRNTFDDSKKFLFFKGTILNQKLNPRMTFEENIDNLINYYIKQGITKEKFNAWVDLDSLNTIYNYSVNDLKKSNSERNILLFIIFIMIIILFIIVGE